MNVTETNIRQFSIMVNTSTTTWDIEETSHTNPKRLVRNRPQHFSIFIFKNHTAKTPIVSICEMGNVFSFYPIAIKQKFLRAHGSITRTIDGKITYNKFTYILKQ